MMTQNSIQFETREVSLEYSRCAQWLYGMNCSLQLRQNLITRSVIVAGRMYKSTGNTDRTATTVSLFELYDTKYDLNTRLVTNLHSTLVVIE